MKMIICSIHDKASDAYMRPFFCQTKGQAIRMFVDLIDDENTDIARHKEDYALFEVGTWNDNTAELMSIEPICLMRAHEKTALEKNLERLSNDELEGRNLNNGVN